MIRRHFLDWSQPLLGQAVGWLAREWRGDGPLDLSSLVVVVPTRHSGRRLREALAAHAAAKAHAVFAPRVITPDEMSFGASPDVASRLVSLLAWAEVLRSIDLADYRDLFPVDPAAQNFSWALALAHQFERLQRTLAEAGLRLGDVAGRAGSDLPERARWEQIRSLDERHAAHLAQRGRREPQAARIAAAAAPAPPAGVSRIVLLATPDPFPLALSALRELGRRLPVDVVVFGPAEAGAGGPPSPGFGAASKGQGGSGGSEGALFDDWGRPVAAAWKERTIDLPDFERHVHLCADPNDEAALVAAAASAGSPTWAGAIGVADPEVIPPIELDLRRAGIATFNPEGASRRGDGLHQLLAALANLAREDSFAAGAALARCPDFLAFVAPRLGGTGRAAAFLAALDDLQNEHLPPTLRDAQRHAAEGPGKTGLATLAEIRRILEAGRFPDALQAALGVILKGRKYDLSRADDARAAENLEAWAEIGRDLADAAAVLGPLEDADGWEVGLALYAAGRRFAERPAGAIDLQGWLELLWEDAPHLVVAGLNEGFVPDAVVGDLFLPEALRVRLGLKTNADRFARDSYLLQALAASRLRHARGAPLDSALGTPPGRLDLLLAKVSGSGEPLRPSRLLLRCRDEDLPARVNFLFGAAPGAGARPAWRRAWKLQVPQAAASRRIAATALTAWLQCPFRFYLGRVLKLEAVDPEKAELDALEFGTLCHAALQAMGSDPALRQSTDERTLRDFLIAQLELEVARRYGRELTLPLIFQVESARQRLGRAAAIQARTRAEGWVIEAVEEKFRLPVGDIVVSGQVDRLERHEQTGEWRVLDYKTSDTGVAPEAVAWRSLGRAEVVPDFARFEGGPREPRPGRGDRVWANLQLPVYLRAVRQLELSPEAAGGKRPVVGPEAIVTCGYFNLPKAAGEAGIARWEGYSREVDESAWRCVEGVVAAIGRGEFWPPAEGVPARVDPFAALFHQGAAASIGWRDLKSEI